VSVGASPELPANADRVAAALLTGFATEEACEAFLAECRRPDGFRCPRRGPRNA
jgi:hypothetical protein